MNEQQRTAQDHKAQNHKARDRQAEDHQAEDELICGYYASEGEAGELSRLEARRLEATAQTPVSDEFLAAQRRAIYARMGERPRSFGAWVPALATAAALAIGLLVYHPHAVSHSQHPAAAVVQPELADSQLFSELVSVEQSAEPRAALPIRALFEGTE